MSSPRSRSGSFIAPVVTLPAVLATSTSPATSPRGSRRSGSGSGSSYGLVGPTGSIPLRGSSPSPPTSPGGTRRSVTTILPAALPAGSPPTSPRGTRLPGTTQPIAFLPATGARSPRSRSPSPPRSGTSMSSYGSVVAAPLFSNGGITGTRATGTISPRSMTNHSSPVNLIGGTPVPIGPAVQPIPNPSARTHASSHTGPVFPVSSSSYKPRKARGITSPKSK